MIVRSRLVEGLPVVGLKLETSTVPKLQLTPPEASAGEAGEMVGDKQVILAGIQSGQQVVSNVLQLEATLEAQ